MLPSPWRHGAMPQRAAGDPSGLHRGSCGPLVPVARSPVTRAPVGRLSQGQQRRLHLAMCLALDPDLLLLDEPTNHLSSSLVDDITTELLQTSCAVIVATHDRQMLKDLADWPHLHLDPKDPS